MTPRCSTSLNIVSNKMISDDGEEEGGQGAIDGGGVLKSTDVESKQ